VSPPTRGCTPAGWPGCRGGAGSGVQLTGTSIAVLRAYTPYADSSNQAESTVRYVRAHDRVDGAQVMVTGNTAFDMDYVQYMLDQTPWAVVYVMVTTFLLLMLLLRSVVLPLKAVLMNLLSLSASFGRWSSSSSRAT